MLFIFFNEFVAPIRKGKESLFRLFFVLFRLFYANYCIKLKQQLSLCRYIRIQQIKEQIKKPLPYQLLFSLCRQTFGKRNSLGAFMEKSSRLLFSRRLFCLWMQNYIIGAKSPKKILKKAQKINIFDLFRYLFVFNPIAYIL